LETARLDEAGERARLYGGMAGRVTIGPLTGREVQMIKAGARTCARCEIRPSAVPVGDPRHLRALCATCADAARLDQRVQRQRAERAAMARRR
jgi:hypothetical protein